MSEPTKNRPDLNEELSQLGKNIEYAFRAALQSEQVRTIQRDIAGGLEQINMQFQTLSERGQAAINQAQESLGQTQTQLQSGIILKEFQDALAQGVLLINQQISEFAARMESETESPTGAQKVTIEDDEDEHAPESAAPPPPPSPASTAPPVQTIPIEGIEEDNPPSSPAVGETIRLTPESPAEQSPPTENS